MVSDPQSKVHGLGTAVLSALTIYSVFQANQWFSLTKTAAELQ